MTFFLADEPRYQQAIGRAVAGAPLSQSEVLEEIKAHRRSKRRHAADPSPPRIGHSAINIKVTGNKVRREGSGGADGMVSCTKIMCP